MMRATSERSSFYRSIIESVSENWEGRCGEGFWPMANDCCSLSYPHRVLEFEDTSGTRVRTSRV